MQFKTFWVIEFNKENNAWTSFKRKDLGFKTLKVLIIQVKFYAFVDPYLFYRKKFRKKYIF